MLSFRWMSALLMALGLIVRIEVSAQVATKDWGCYDAKPGHPTAAEKASFIEQISPLAIKAEKKYGVPASALAAMAIVESGYGWTRTAQNAQNLFGWKFYSSKAASGRKAYVLTCQPKEDDNNRYVVFETNADSFDFVAMKLATLPAYSKQTKAYQATRAKGITATEAAKAWIAGIANPYNWHPKEYTTTITRVMNNALAPSDQVSEEFNLYRLSNSTVAVTSNIALTVTTASAPDADTDAILASIKAKLALKKPRHCDPPIMDFPRWKGFPVQLCDYQEKGVSVRTYMLNASPEQRARWIVNACLDIHAASTKSCTDQLTDWIHHASSDDVFPVAGFIPEPANSARSKGDHILCLLFRDGITVAVKGVDSPAAVNNRCDSKDDPNDRINDRPVTTVKKYARIASTTREDYVAYTHMPRAAVSSLKWIDVIRNQYQQAWTSDRNELITAKAHALMGTGAPKKRN